MSPPPPSPTLKNNATCLYGCLLDFMKWTSRNPRKINSAKKIYIYPFYSIRFICGNLVKITLNNQWFFMLFRYIVKINCHALIKTYSVPSRNAVYQDRLPYCRRVHVPPAPVRQLSASSNVDTQPFFYTSHSPRPRSLKERERVSRHFINPEWRSEDISWVRFDQPNTRNIDRLSLFWTCCCNCELFI